MVFCKVEHLLDLALAKTMKGRSPPMLLSHASLLRLEEHCLGMRPSPQIHTYTAMVTSLPPSKWRNGPGTINTVWCIASISRIVVYCRYDNGITGGVMSMVTAARIDITGQVLHGACLLALCVLLQH